MKEAKIVIGANFGDEGKGLMTDYYAQMANKAGSSCLVVCHNGGSQRGHTVQKQDGRRIVFHHFGSGCLEGADTYLSSDFVVNPILFLKDHQVLLDSGCRTGCYVHPDCRFTTPFDMLINQIAEELRGENRHGSCGLGVWETGERYRLWGGLGVDAFLAASPGVQTAYLREIANAYFPARLASLGIRELPEKWQAILSKKEILIENCILDMMQMGALCQREGDGILDRCDTVIFEGAQGLLLDEDNLEYMPFLTPSKTGLHNPKKLLGSRDAEVCYVTRTYMTRHGPGRFDSECPREQLNPGILDLTNADNEFQGSLRFGKLDLNQLRSRIEADASGWKGKKSLAVTHVNEYPVSPEELKRLFPNYGIYLSDGFTAESVTRWK